MLELLGLWCVDLEASKPRPRVQPVCARVEARAENDEPVDTGESRCSAPSPFISVFRILYTQAGRVDPYLSRCVGGISDPARVAGVWYLDGGSLFD